MRLGLYVGSFNPVHNGHLKVIHYLLDHDLIFNSLVANTIINEDVAINNHKTTNNNLVFCDFIRQTITNKSFFN